MSVSLARAVPPMEWLVQEGPECWSWIPPFAVGVVYEIRWQDGRYVLSEAIHTPHTGNPDRWAYQEERITRTGSLDRAVATAATHFQRDYC